MKTNTKGFTLIELLIVIAIIGILAVAFVPTLLDAPARGRDGQRQAHINTIRTVLIDGQLRNENPGASGCISNENFGMFLEEFGGNIPRDPRNLAPSVNGQDLCQDTYIYVAMPGDYKFGIYAKMENGEAGNASCAALAQDATDIQPVAVDNSGNPLDSDSCYAILVQ